MKSYIYLLESIFVVVLFGIALLYLQTSTNFIGYIDSFQKVYGADTAIYSLYNSNFLEYIVEGRIEISSFILYNLFKNFFQNFDQRYEFYGSVYINNVTGSCSIIFYPFPNIFGYSGYYSNQSGIPVVYFFLYSYNGQMNNCNNFTVSTDWYLIYFNQTYPTVSLNLSYFPVTGNLDLCSIYAFDSFGHEINITEIAYSNNVLNISFPYVLNNLVFLEIRFYQNHEFSNNCNRYLIVNSLPGNLLGYNYVQSSWLTLYISNECLQNNSFIVVKYTIPPDIQNPNQIQIFNTSSCNIIDFSFPAGIRDYYLSDFYKYFSVYPIPLFSYQYIRSFLINKGLDFIKITVYGS